MTASGSTEDISLSGYVDEMVAFTRESQGVRIRLRVAALPLLRVLVAGLLASRLLIACFGFDFVPGGVGRLFDRLFALRNVCGEVGIRRGLRDGGRLFGITKYGRVSLRPDKCSLKIDRPYCHPG
jgi:hypothetical protein